MIRLFKFLIWGDAHLCKWEDAGKVTAFYEYSKDDMPYKRSQPMQCAICGKRKSFKL